MEHEEFLSSKPLYLEILRNLVSMETSGDDVTPSIIARRMNKAISTVSEPMNEMFMQGILQKKESKDRRKSVYMIVDAGYLNSVLKKAESEGNKTNKLMIDSEIFKQIRKYETELNHKIREQLQRISNKISVFEDYNVRSVFGDVNINLLISSFEKIRIGVDYKIILGEKKLRENRMSRINNKITKKYFPELLGNFISAEENELDGILSIIVIPGIDNETKIFFEKSIQRIQHKGYNFDVIIANYKTSDFENELVTTRFSEEIVNKVNSLKNTAKRKQYNETSTMHSIGSSIFKNNDKSIAILGIGGAGNNLVNWISKKRIEGATTIAYNTDIQHLNTTEADKKYILGKEIIKGPDCAGFPESGTESAMESINEIRGSILGYKMVFVCVGLGGGTGSGAAPIIAKIAKKLGILTIGVVVLPFTIEGNKVNEADTALERIYSSVDALIVIENNKLMSIGGHLSVQQLLSVGNEIISSMIKGIIDTITIPSLVNLDFTDVKSILEGAGFVTFGIGSSDTKNKVSESVNGALANMFFDVDFKNATGCIIHIIGGPELSLEDINRIGELTTDKLNHNANVIWSAKVEDEMRGKITVVIIVAGVQPKKYSIETLLSSSL